MIALAWLIPLALFLGGLGLAAFIWALRSGQFDDLEGAAYRGIEDDPLDEEPPKPSARRPNSRQSPSVIPDRRRSP